MCILPVSGVFYPSQVCSTCLRCDPPGPLCLLTFLVLKPELLLGSLAGEVDVAGELGAVERLGHVMAAVLPDEGQQLVPRALRVQCLQDFGET